MGMKKASYGLWFLFAIALLSVCICQEDLSGIKDGKSRGAANFFSLQKGNLHINVTNWGATLVSLLVPDAKGNLGDIHLGYDSLASYMKISPTRPYFGAVMGRVGNRIKNAQFKLNGKTYHLFPNDGNNTLHGGRRGFDNVLWQVEKIKGGEKPSIKFHYHSFDGEEGFPGDLDVYATYAITGNMELRLDMEAIPRNKPTPVSLIHHAYWNLAGHNSGKKILDHTVKIWASHYTPSDKHLIPTGQILPLKGTALDFTKEATIGSRINKVPSYEVPPGFDHNYVLNSPMLKKMGLRIAARAKDPKSKRVLEVYTNNPTMQFYTSNNMKPTVGKGGVIYKPHFSFAFETQAFPDAVNNPNFPSVILHPGQFYRHAMLLKFSVEK